MQKNMSFPYWSQSSNDVINQLSSQVEGLSQKEAKQRVETFGLNTLKVICVFIYVLSCRNKSSKY